MFNKEIAEKLISGLIETEEHKFAKNTAKNFDFTFSNRWEKTQEYILRDLQDPQKAKCTVDNLNLVIDRVLISSNHHIFVSTYENAKTDLVGLIQKNTFNIPKSIYSDNFPCTVDFNSNPKESTGHFLCKVTDTGDGFAFIFASIIKEQVGNYRSLASLMELKQFFNCVFIPKERNRIEVRISNKVSPKHLSNFNIELQQKFIEMLDSKHIKTTFKPVNLIKSIKNIFNDKTEGRVAHAILTTEESNKDAELKNVSDKGYCARTQQVTDTKSKHTYVCRAIKIRKPYINNATAEVEYNISPNKLDWQNNHCFSLQVDKPETSTMLTHIVDNVIQRSL